MEGGGCFLRHRTNNLPRDHTETIQYAYNTEEHLLLSAVLNGRKVTKLLLGPKWCRCFSTLQFSEATEQKLKLYDGTQIPLSVERFLLRRVPPN